MDLQIGDIIVLQTDEEPSCDNAREVVYIGPGLVCLCYLMHAKMITTRGRNDLDCLVLYRRGDENAD